MTTQGTVTVHEVIAALRELGGEADSDEIKKRVIAKRNNILPSGYAKWTNYLNTIDQLVHYYCPQCKKYLGREIYFQQVSRGRYRLAQDANDGKPLKRAVSSVPQISLPQKSLRHKPDVDKNTVVAIAEEEDELAFPEGKTVYRLHRTKERNPQLIARVKSKRIKIDPLLHCDVCGFSFVEEFGDFGKGFIEAHHAIPVSQLLKSTVTKESDIALVCPNCHRMLHRYRPWLSVEKLRAVLANKNRRTKATR